LIQDPCLLSTRLQRWAQSLGVMPSNSVGNLNVKHWSSPIINALCTTNTTLTAEWTSSFTLFSLPTCGANVGRRLLPSLLLSIPLAVDQTWPFFLHAYPKQPYIFPVVRMDLGFILCFNILLFSLLRKSSSLFSSFIR